MKILIIIAALLISLIVTIGIGTGIYLMGGKDQ